MNRRDDALWRRAVTIAADLRHLQEVAIEREAFDVSQGLDGALVEIEAAIPYEELFPNRYFPGRPPKRSYAKSSEVRKK